MSEHERFIDADTSDQLKNWIDAEAVYGEKLVARVLRVTWSWENDADFLWSINECHECFKEQVVGREGYVWGKPIGDSGHSELLTYCSEECVDKAINDWGHERQMDVVTGYYKLE